VSEPFGPISDLGNEYLAGALRQQHLEGDFSPSARDDVLHCENLTSQQRDMFESAALVPLRQGAVALSVLAAGASSRMHLRDIPPDVADMVRDCGRTELPSSKALVPVVKLHGEVFNYLDLFLINAQRFSQQAGSETHAVIFVSESNADEIRDHLDQVNYRGFPRQRVLTFVQPLEPQIVAKVDDIKKAEKHFAAADLNQVLMISEKYAGHDLPQRKPGGHGEFLHQLIARGTLGELLERGVKYLSVRNIDNTAALHDQNWLSAFGYFLSENADMLVEVAQRPHGQKGGALIRQQNRWRIAEDPSFVGTRCHASDSYYINAAVAIMRCDYFYPIYETSDRELREAMSQPLPERNRKLQAIAQRGRAKFPTLLDAKPVKLPDGKTVGAVTPETNMWESTGIDARLKVLPLAVDSDRDAGEDLVAQAEEARRQRALRVRFSPTKTWADYEDANKQCIVRYVAEKIVNGKLI